MAMDLSRFLGFGAEQPLVDLEGDDEVGAAARTPAPTAPASSPSTPSPSFLSDTILGLAPDEGRNVRRSLAGGLSAAAANYDKPAMAAAMASFGGALGGKPVRIAAEGERGAQQLGRGGGGSVASAISEAHGITAGGEGAGDPSTKKGRQALYLPFEVPFDYANQLVDKHPNVPFVGGSDYSTWILYGNRREIKEDGTVTGYIVTDGQILTARAGSAANPTLTVITEDSAAYVNKKTGAVSRVERT